MSSQRRCLYEILGVPRDANETEIKKAYRSQALANHPDKNPTRQEEAAELFKLVQHAYDVLSDTHERAWYDSHRTQILRGHDPSSNPDEPLGPSAATDVDLFAYFTSSCFDGFGKGLESFFGVYSKVFDQLWAEEEDVAATSKSRLRPSAMFGGCDADWETVRNFYREWDSFTSIKSFSFADKWNLSEAPNRDYRRAMERENKKERAKVKKEFNATVRELVAFVKKRDPRVAAYRQKEAEDREQLERESKQRAQRKAEERRNQAEEMRAARDEALEEDADALDEILASIALDERLERKNNRKKGRRQRSSESEVSENESEVESATGRQSGKSDHDVLDGNRDGADAAGDGANSVNSGHAEDLSEEEAPEELYCIACRKPFRTSAQKMDHERSKKHKSAMAKLKKELKKEEDVFSAASCQGKPGISGTANDREQTEDSISIDLENTVADDDIENSNLNPSNVFMSTKSKKNRKKQAQRRSAFPQFEADVIEDLGGNVETGALDSNGDSADTGKTPEQSQVISQNADAETANEPIVGGSVREELSKKEKRRRRQQKKKEAGKTPSVGASSVQSLRCNVCGAGFPSRNKLMRHVESSGHALHVNRPV